ncbi:MAG: hypothetical protein GY849_04220 [Deltaproteobacteria bacterium]|nr:hypothetical protein [Deltaproteobacteria bacterium]
MDLKDPWDLKTQWVFVDLTAQWVSRTLTVPRVSTDHSVLRVPRTLMAQEMCADLTDLKAL